MHWPKAVQPEYEYMSVVGVFEKLLEDSKAVVERRTAKVDAAVMKNHKSQEHTRKNRHLEWRCRHLRDNGWEYIGQRDVATMMQLQVL